MGSWGAAAIIFHADPRAVEARLTQLSAAAGRTRWLTAAPRVPERWDPMQYGDGESSPTWGAAVIPSVEACLVVTAPPLLLLEETSEQGVVRLQALARALACPCAFLRLADTCVAAVEVLADGTLTASGLGEPRRPLAVGDVTLSADTTAARFSALKVPAAVNEALASGDAAEGFAAALEALVPGCPPLELLQRSLLSLRRIPRRGARTLYLRRRPEALAPEHGLFELDLEPLEVAVGTGLALVAGGGRAELVNGQLAAGTPEEGAPLLAALALWLELPAPPTPEHGVTDPVFTVLAPKSDAPRRLGVTTEVLTVGERKPASLLVHRAIRGPKAQLEERDAAQRQRLLETLAKALVGRHGRPAPVPRLALVRLPATPRLYVAPAGDGFVVACWRQKTTMLYAVKEGEAPRELCEVRGVATALASLGTRFALTVAEPILRRSAWPGVGIDCPSRLLIGTLEAAEPRELWRSSDSERCGFTQVVGSPDGALVAVSIEAAARLRQTLVLDVETGDALYRSAELVNAEPASWDEAGLLLRGRDHRTFADRWYRWALPSEPRLTHELFVASTGAPMKADALRGFWLPPGPLVRRGDRVAMVAGDDGARAAVYDAARGTCTELFPIDGLALAAFGEGRAIAATQADRRLYLAEL